MEYATTQQLNASKTADKLDKQYGSRIKREEKDQQSLVFIRGMLSMGGTFEFTDAHKQIGYGTIFEAMAADLYEPGANMKTKILNGEAYEHIYRRGLSALNEKLMDEWDNTIVYALPRQVNDKQIQVITMDGTLVINDLGQTAAEVHAMREGKRAEGQVRASAKKLTRSIGPVAAWQKLEQIVEQAKSFTMLPNGSRENEQLPDFS